MVSKAQSFAMKVKVIRPKTLNEYPPPPPRAPQLQSVQRIDNEQVTRKVERQDAQLGKNK